MNNNTSTSPAWGLKRDITDYIIFKQPDLVDNMNNIVSEHSSGMLG